MTGVAGAPYRLADPLSRVANQYAAVVIDTRPSFSLMTEMGLLAATDAIVPVEPRYLETVGLMSVISKINDVREGWQHPTLQISGILVTKLDMRVRGHKHLPQELRMHSVLGKLVCGVIPGFLRSPQPPEHLRLRSSLSGQQSLCAVGRPARPADVESWCVMPKQSHRIDDLLVRHC